MFKDEATASNVGGGCGVASPFSGKWPQNLTNLSAISISFIEIAGLLCRHGKCKYLRDPWTPADQHHITQLLRLDSCILRRHTPFISWDRAGRYYRILITGFYYGFLYSRPRTPKKASWALVFQEDQEKILLRNIMDFKEFAIPYISEYDGP